MSAFQKAFMLVLALPLSVMASFAGEHVLSMNRADALRAADTYLQAQADRGFGGAVLIARDGAVLLAKGYGYANREWRIPNTPQTRFRIASLTKSFTAVAVMQLYEKQRLALEDSICSYLDPCEESWRKVTIRHLLSNSSGIPNHFSGTEIDRALPATRDQVLARIRRKPLEFAPGAKFNYGNANWYLLGMIVEKVAQKSYERVLREQIFVPLGMNDTGTDDRARVLEHRASGYSLANPPNGPLINATYDDVSWVTAAASLYSTIEDLYKFAHALEGTTLLTARSKELMWASSNLPTHGVDEPASYGFGWWVFPPGRAGRRFVVRGTGGMAGFESGLSVYPDDDVTIIVLTNSPGEMALDHHLATAIFGEFP
jgi:CubicO group peptidase (beta-lactamase class C family)